MTDDLHVETMTGQMPGYTPAWWALLRDVRVSDGAVRLYLTIASHTRGHRNVAWPGQDRLAELSGRDVRTVQRLLAELVAAKWIVTRRPNAFRGNRYIVMMPAQSVDNGVDDGAQGARPDDRFVVSEATNLSSPKEVTEHEVEPPVPPLRVVPRARVNRAPLDDSERAADFALWWDAYPRKKSKLDAMIAWRQTLADVPDLTAMIEAAAMLARTTRSEHPGADDWGKYMPYPATFIRGQRWLDTPEPGTAVAATRRHANPCALCAEQDPLLRCSGETLRWDFDPETECPWRR